MRTRLAAVTAVGRDEASGEGLLGHFTNHHHTPALTRPLLSTRTARRVVDWPTTRPCDGSREPLTFPRLLCSLHALHLHLKALNREYWTLSSSRPPARSESSTVSQSPAASNRWRSISAANCPPCLCVPRQVSKRYVVSCQHPAFSMACTALHCTLPRSTFSASLLRGRMHEQRPAEHTPRRELHPSPLPLREACKETPPRTPSLVPCTRSGRGIDRLF